MKIQIMLAALALAVSSCSEKKSVTGEHSELILSGQVMFDGQTGAAVKAAAGSLDPLPATNLGVYVLTVSGDAKTDFTTTAWKNEGFVSDAAGIISGGNVILRTGTTYDIYAYAPRVAGVSDAHAVPVRHGDDVLWACTPGTVATAGGTKAKLEFRHCGAQIGFRLKAGDGKTDLTGAKMKVSGFFDTGALDVATGKMTVSGPARIIDDKSGKKTNVLTDGTPTTFTVEVTDVPGKTESFTGSFTKALQPGMAYLYDVTVNMDGATISFKGQVVDWVNVETADPLPVE